MVMLFRYNTCLECIKTFVDVLIPAGVDMRLDTLSGAVASLSPPQQAAHALLEHLGVMYETTGRLLGTAAVLGMLASVCVRVCHIAPTR